jgi:hypothetical protein
LDQGLKTALLQPVNRRTKFVELPLQLTTHITRELN